MVKNKLKKEEKGVKSHKMTSFQKRQLTMKIAGWIMCLIMIAGVIMTFLSFFVY